MLTFFHRLWHPPSLARPRLSHEQVRALVAEAVRVADIHATLGALSLRRRDGQFTWIAKTATKRKWLTGYRRRCNGHSWTR